MQVFIRVMIFEHKMPQMIYRAVTHSGHQISMNLFQIYGFDAVPEGSEHIIENILVSFFIVYNMQGIIYTNLIKFSHPAVKECKK